MDVYEFGMSLVNRVWGTLSVEERKKLLRRCGHPQRSIFSRTPYYSIEDFPELMHVSESEEDPETFKRTLPLMHLILAIAQASNPMEYGEFMRKMTKEPFTPVQEELGKELMEFRYEDIPDVEGGD